MNPHIQSNEKMGLIASPDTKHYLTYDIYTHVTSAPVKEEYDHDDHEGHTEEENYKAPRIVKVAVGDTIHTRSGIVTVKALNTKPTAKRFSIGGR